MKIEIVISLVLVYLLTGISKSGAAPRFARIFGDACVLQRDVEISLWGDGADPSAALKVRFGEAEVSARVDRDGRWKASIPPHTGNGTGKELSLIENGALAVSLKDVVVGEVWLAAGQSNMQMRVGSMLKGLPESRDWVDSANRPNIRLRRIDDPVLAGSKKEAADLNTPGEWTRMTPETVLGFSAVASVFARALHDELGAPIGIIDVSWGGKPIEPFIPREAFDSPLLADIRELADAGKLEELAALPGGLIIRNPEGHPGAIFNARMAPLTSMKLRGFLWYQAESNAGNGEDPRDYREKMRALVEGWRARWNEERLPAYFVQLPSFAPATGWIRMREEQRRSLAIANTGMAVTIDIRGEGIHPPDKIAVGQRLARLALKNTYGRRAVADSGPLYQSHEINGGEIRVRFSHTEGGLMVADKPGFGPPGETPDAPLRWFELAGKDGVWHPATATIDGDTVIVSSARVTGPVAVRYACETSPQGGNLYNRAGLPASPFCSDLEKLPWVDPKKK